MPGYRQTWQADVLTHGFSLTNSGTEPVYLHATLAGYEKERPSPVNEGIQVRRSYYDLQGQQVKQRTFKTGELLMVRLDISMDDYRPHLLVVDQLPAGLELENQNLTHSFALGELTIDGQDVVKLLNQQDIRHQEYRDDRYVAAVNSGWRKRASLFYLVRAVTPGNYQVPATFAEDMYRPERRHIGKDAGRITIVP